MRLKHCVIVLAAIGGLAAPAIAGAPVKPTPGPVQDLPSHGAHAVPVTPASAQPPSPEPGNWAYIWSALGLMAFLAHRRRPVEMRRY